MIARILDVQLGLFATVFTDHVVKYNIKPYTCISKGRGGEG